MYVEETGLGDRTVVAIHGWAGTHRDFAAIAARMPTGFRILSIDLPGCGRSPAPGEWTTEALIDPVGELVISLDDPRTVVVGFCSGAIIALMVAAKLPDMVGRVIMIDPLLFVPWYFSLFTWGEFGERAYAATFCSQLGRRITNSVLQRRQGRGADFTAAFAEVNHEVTLNHLRVFARSQARGAEAFGSVRTPVDICHGERTFAAVRRSVKDLRAALPHACIHELGGIGHLPLARGARRIAAIIAQGPAQADA